MSNNEKYNILFLIAVFILAVLILALQPPEQPVTERPDHVESR